MLKLKILTPRKVVLEEEASSVSVPAVDGELSILPQHAKLLTTLSEGIVTIRNGSKEDYFAIGGGYLETDGKELRILVSRAYGQNEIDEATTKKALETAQKLMSEKPDKQSRIEAMTVIKRSLIDMKLLRKRRRSAL